MRARMSPLPIRVRNGMIHASGERSPLYLRSMTKALDITGQRFGQLVALRRTLETNKKWTFRCDCGNEKVMFSQNVRLGRTKSCGCTSHQHRNHFRQLDQKSFEKRIHDIFGDKYDLSKAVYKGTKQKVDIICSDHGEFQATPDSLFTGAGCPECGRIKSGLSRRIDDGLTNVQRQRKKDKENPAKVIENLLRSRISQALKANKAYKCSKSQDLLGCTYLELKKHLASKFLLGMTWNNRGLHGWHIDHIRPCASFDLTDPEQQKQCFHYTNLQPLWAEDNLRKSDKWEPELQAA